MQVATIFAFIVLLILILIIGGFFGYITGILSMMDDLEDDGDWHGY